MPHRLRTSTAHAQEELTVFAHRLVEGSLTPERINVISTKWISERKILVQLDEDFVGSSSVELAGGTASLPVPSLLEINPQTDEPGCVGRETNPLALYYFVPNTIEDESGFKAIHLELVKITGFDIKDPEQSLAGIYALSRAAEKYPLILNQVERAFSLETTRVKLPGREAAHLDAHYDYETIDRTYSGVIHESPARDPKYHGDMDLDGIGGPDFDALLKKYSESSGAKKMNEYLKRLLATGIKVFLPKGAFPEIQSDLAAKITWEQLPADATTVPFYKRMLGVR